MTRDERGRWFRVYARQVRQHPKFRGLNMTQLGAWLTLRSEAELRDGAVFTDRAEAALMLKRRGCPRPAAMVDGLIALRLFDERDDGALEVHDRADHDRQTFPSDDPDAVKERVQRHRKRKRNEDVTSRNDSETTPVRAPSGAGADSSSVSDEGESEGESTPSGWDAVDSVVTWHDLTGRYPSEKVIEWLNRLSDAHPEEAICRVLAEQYAEDTNPGTLLSRTDNALKLDAHRREKADKAAHEAFMRRLEEEHRQRVENATPEQREQAEFQKKAIRIGLHLGIDVPTEPEEVRKFVMKHGSAA